MKKAAISIIVAGLFSLVSFSNCFASDLWTQVSLKEAATFVRPTILSGAKSVYEFGPIVRIVYGDGTEAVYNETAVVKAVALNKAFASAAEEDDFENALAYVPDIL